jgi:hypothetical protein
MFRQHKVSMATKLHSTYSAWKQSCSASTNSVHGHKAPEHCHIDCLETYSGVPEHCQIFCLETAMCHKHKQCPWPRSPRTLPHRLLGNIHVPPAQSVSMATKPERTATLSPWEHPCSASRVPEHCHIVCLDTSTFRQKGPRAPLLRLLGNIHVSPAGSQSNATSPAWEHSCSASTTSAHGHKATLTSIGFLAIYSPRRA